MPSSTRSFRLPLRALAVSASALTLAACRTVGPNFKAPAAPSGAAAAGYAMAGDAAAPGVRLSPDARTAGPWWQVFGSPELDGAIRQALANSPSVAEARATLERSQAEARAVRGAQFAQVDANAAAERERINLAAFGFSGFPGSRRCPSPTINLFSVGGSVSYDLDLFGGHKRATEAANARADAAARQADAAYLSLSGNVAMQAMRIASLRAQIAESNAIVADDRRVIDIVRKAEAAGGEAHTALSGGVAQLAEDEALLPPLQRDLDAARHQLALLVGKAPAEWTAPDFDLAQFTPPDDIPVSLPSSLIRTRPDILAAEADLHAATAAIGVAVANQYPEHPALGGAHPGSDQARRYLPTGFRGLDAAGRAHRADLSRRHAEGGETRRRGRRPCLARPLPADRAAGLRAGVRRARGSGRRPGGDRLADAGQPCGRLRRAGRPERASARWRPADRRGPRAAHPQPRAPRPGGSPGSADERSGVALRGDGQRLGRRPHSQAS